MIFVILLGEPVSLESPVGDDDNSGSFGDFIEDKSAVNQADALKPHSCIYTW